MNVFSSIWSGSPCTTTSFLLLTFGIGLTRVITTRLDPLGLGRMKYKIEEIEKEPDIPNGWVIENTLWDNRTDTIPISGGGWMIIEPRFVGFILRLRGCEELSILPGKKYLIRKAE